MAHVGIVVLQQHVVPQVRRARAADFFFSSFGLHTGKDALAEEAHRVRPGERRRPVADRDVEAVALEILHARLGGDAHVDARDACA